ncbi:MAG TPA: FAD-dependent oxidoreductase [Gammaproteobacteria bacterium]|nr:FAD-dependent oxidoreductase [Gammaproteobacteria bacterium]
MTSRAAGASYPGAEHDAILRSMVFPPGYVNPPARPRYHLIVIGAGPAGLICALGAASLGATVALVERQAMGGDCLNVGCIPSKALLEHSRSHGGRASFDAAFAWMRDVRARIAVNDSVERYTGLGVDVFLGEATFVDDATVQVHDRQLVGRRIVIATGARPLVPDIPGLRDAAPLTNESIFDLQRAPDSLAIIGAGAVGCELAQAFARMGIDVHLLDVATRVLPTEIPQASAVIANALLRAGVDLRLGVRVSRVDKLASNTRVDLGDDEIDVDRVLVAAGRAANVDSLNLDIAGVELTADGLVAVDDYLRTSNRRIYAAGDVCSRQQFTHHADAQARIVLRNALFGPFRAASTLVVPRCVYTDPELAHVGSSVATLEVRGVAFVRHRIDLTELDRGRAADDREMFVELLVCPRKGRLLGATIVAPGAGELIVPVCIAMAAGLSLGQLGDMEFPYPTRSEFLRRAADRYNRTRLTPMVARLVRTWLRITR